MTRISEIRYTRTLRTSSSERFLAQGPEGTDVAAFDVHYLEDGTVAVTLIILDIMYFDGSPIEEFIKSIDAHLLPMASMNESDLVFTVVTGKYHGQYQNAGLDGA